MCRFKECVEVACPIGEPSGALVPGVGRLLCVNKYLDLRKKKQCTNVGMLFMLHVQK